MVRVENPSYWKAAYASCQLPALRRVEHPDDLLDTVGVHLKSVFQDNEWKYFGILVQYKDDEVVVIGSAASPNLVWTGTVEQYEQMWCVD